MPSKEQRSLFTRWITRRVSEVVKGAQRNWSVCTNMLETGTSVCNTQLEGWNLLCPGNP